MKKLFAVLLLMLFVTGCSVRETFETISDLHDVQTAGQMYQLQLSLPEEAAIPSLENAEEGKIYLCDGYVLTVQTMDAGDVDRTLRQLTGYGRDQLTVMQTRPGEYDRYECVWSAAGEAEDQVGRCVILDDGAYHYAVTVMANFSAVGELTPVWQSILSSVCLVSTD